MSKKKGVNIDLAKVMGWCKTNLILVILAVSSIAAVVGLPRVAATQALEVEEALRGRTEYFNRLDKLLKTPVTDPKTGKTGRVVVNPKLNSAYEKAISALRGDSENDIDEANKLNRKEYSVLYASQLFPNPIKSQRETLPQLFHRELELKYKQLLELANAGSATTNEELASFLEDARVRYMETNLSTRQDADLTKEQRKNLEIHLAKLRRVRLRSQAADISVYFDEATLNIPAFSLQTIPSVGELFTWQWRYWAVADIVSAIAAINDGQTEITSPIKRVVSIDIVGLPVPVEGTGQGEGSRPPRGSNPPRPPGSGGGPGGQGGPGGPGGPGRNPPQPNPTAPGGRPPSGGGVDGMYPSHTGQKSGDLYDLLQVQLTLVVDTNRIPQVLDNFASHNFLTIIDLDLQQTDKFVAMGAGYDYGIASVSQMTIVMEAAWLRSWTVEFMPDSVKSALGIKTDGQ